MPTLTVQPARCSPRNTSVALYAAMPPLIPNATFFSVKELSKEEPRAGTEIEDQCNIAETRAQRSLTRGLLQSGAVPVKRFFSLSI